MHLNMQFNPGKSIAAFFFDDEGKAYLLQKLAAVCRNQDHEVFLLGSELDDQSKYADDYYICDFLNIVFMDDGRLSKTQEKCFPVTKNKHREYYSVELAFSPSAISEFISGLESLNKRSHRYIQLTPEGLAMENGESLAIHLQYI